MQLAHLDALLSLKTAIPAYLDYIKENEVEILGCDYWQHWKIVQVALKCDWWLTDVKIEDCVAWHPTVQKPGRTVISCGLLEKNTSDRINETQQQNQTSAYMKLDRPHSMSHRQL